MHLPPVPLRGWGAVGVGAVLALWFAVRWTLVPASVPIDEVEPADAVVLFAGSGERLPVALQLMADRRADVLVLPNGNRDGWPEANVLCTAPADELGYEVVCPVPDPVTTAGEARAIGRVAAERGWGSVVAVTSTYHLARAELLLGRCFPGHIQPVAAHRDMTRSQWWRAARHELAGHLGHRLLLRGC